MVLSFSCILLYYLEPIKTRLVIYNGGDIRVNFLLLICVCYLFNFLLKTYQNIWKYAEVGEYLLLIVANGLGCLTYLAFDAVYFDTSISFWIVSVFFSISTLTMLTYRFVYIKFIRLALNKNYRAKKRLAIIGAGTLGTMLVKTIQMSSKSEYYPVCFVDDDVYKKEKMVHKVKVVGNIPQIPEIVVKYNISDIAIALNSISRVRLQEIISICAKTNCNLKIIDNIYSDVSSESLKTKPPKIRNIKIQDLLGRSSVEFDMENVSNFIYDKTVVITGGGGSIGSELCRQIVTFKPKKIVIIDIYENNAYEIQQELLRKYKDKIDLSIEIASVRDFEKINILFEKYKPEIVFHAAAHKHVPLMEDCPDEAIKNNIFGTYNVVALADIHQVEKMILISTDKAVNPTNIMGATKRFCEMVVQSMNKSSNTKYVAVRFGNVLGSNGSVIPLFKKQIEDGGPITLTDKRITRYFMTIPEAAQLVLQAAAMAKKSEIYVLDMGKPVKILDLAINVIKLSGLVPYQDIDIVEVGLRPGEKLYEELLIDNSNLTVTSNNMIFVEKQLNINPLVIKENLSELKNALDTNCYEIIKATLHKIVPTYKAPEVVNNIFCEGAFQHENVVSFRKIDNKNII